jgi:hypothetical protein
LVKPAAERGNRYRRQRMMAKMDESIPDREELAAVIALVSQAAEAYLAGVDERPARSEVTRNINGSPGRQVNAVRTIFFGGFSR